MEVMLDFEAPITELRKKIEELENLSSSSGIDVSSEISALQKKLQETADLI